MMLMMLMMIIFESGDGNDSLSRALWESNLDTLSACVSVMATFSAALRVYSAAAAAATAAPANGPSEQRM